MKLTAKPIQSTIIWGLIGGLVYIPLCIGLSLMVFWPQNFHLSLSVLLAGYGILLSRWASRPFGSIRFPLLLLFLAGLFINSTPVFLFTAVLSLSWIRSGICLKEKPFIQRFAAEVVLGPAIGLLAANAAPAVNLSWALGVWLFFLIQALYFVVFDLQSEPEIKIEHDPFDKAKMAAETILSKVIF